MKVWCDRCESPMELQSEDADKEIIDDIRDEEYVLICRNCNRRATVIATVDTRNNYQIISSTIKFVTPINKTEALNALKIAIDNAGKSFQLRVPFLGTCISLLRR